MVWKEWLRMLLALMIMVSLAEMLLPAGGLGKISKLVLGLVLILAVLQPFLTLIYRNWDGFELSFQPSLGREEEWRDLAEKVKTAGTKPFLKKGEWEGAGQIKALLLTLDQVNEVEVDLEAFLSSNAEVEIRIDTANPRLKSKARKIVANILNLPEESVLIQEIK
ncbi:MAG: hypothetical protein GX335_05105 [Firmicutes bacterium]|nr:hypothetical protein [Bacillota bacterium]